MDRLCSFYDHAADVARQEKLTMVEALNNLKLLGIEKLEVSQNNLLGREDEVGNELAQCGMGISSIPSYFDFGRDADVEKQALPTLEAARYLGAKRLLVIPGFFREGDSAESREKQFRGMIDGVNRLADLAARYDVSLMMEDYDSALAPFSTIEGVRRFLDSCPGLSWCFDTGNFRFSGESELDGYEILKDRIVHVHLKDRSYLPTEENPPMPTVDGQRLYPSPVGMGDVRLGEVMSRLKADGYQGDFSVEHYGTAYMFGYLVLSTMWVLQQFGITYCPDEEKGEN